MPLGCSDASTLGAVDGVVDGAGVGTQPMGFMQSLGASSQPPTHFPLHVKAQSKLLHLS
jgi:hypothetical protein